MLIDFSANQDTSLPVTDFVIVGSGIAGVGIASELAKRGFSILLLEAGGRSNNYKDLKAFYKADDVINHPPGEMYRRRMLGGTSTVWGGRCIPYEEGDFSPLAAGDGAKWPVSFEEMRPYMDRAVRWLQAGEPEFDAAPCLPNRRAKLVESDAPSISLSEVERFSLPLNSWRDYAASLRKSGRVHVLYNCTAVELVSDDETPATFDLRVCAPNGATRVLKCPTLVLATGGFEIPRLLLASRGRYPNGVGNEYDLVGRYFMTHVVVDAGKLEVRDPSSVALDYERASDGAYVRRLIKVSAEERANQNLMNMIARPAIPNIADPRHKSAILSLAFFAKRFVIPEYRQRLVQRYQGDELNIPAHISNIFGNIFSIPQFALRWTYRRILARRKLPALFLDGAPSYPIQLIGEQAPNRNSRITLSSKTDQFGVPRINIEWLYTTDDVLSLKRSVSILVDALANNSAARLVFSPQDLASLETLAPQGGHHIGTARMSDRPSEGVTDSWGRVWSSDNLYLAGSALFPRSGAANPTLLIAAMAIRTAEYLAEKVRSRPGYKA